MEIGKSVSNSVGNIAWSTIRASVELGVIKSRNSQTYFLVCDSIWIILYQIVSNGLHGSIEDEYPVPIPSAPLTKIIGIIGA